MILIIHVIFLGLVALEAWFWLARPAHERNKLRSKMDKLIEGPAENEEWYCVASGLSKTELLARGGCPRQRGPCPMDIRRHG